MKALLGAAAFLGFAMAPSIIKWIVDWLWPLTPEQKQRQAELQAQNCGGGWVDDDDHWKRSSTFDHAANIDGTPMIPGSGIDIHGNPFGVTRHD